ncbi:glycoside hydrolase family 30 protein [Dothistroma septosporum NZE10]|uniref:Glycoside hydrolase family 30 protein n=1 Tax=Dothistroma septosporum (strain NZE10 / CBS 128990) TaxID=675120 RepID=N1PRV3_DOTSN|nr:glycoside hydrolase family 30 protein [Dothistroma septosporum NZE10]
MLHSILFCVAASTATAICSNCNGTYKLSSIAAPKSGTPGAQPSGTTAWGLVLNETKAAYMQNITGFGAAVTDATVVNFNKMSSTQQTNFINAVMTSSGANFSLIRHTIGGSDMSATNYTYDDMPAGKTDTNLTSFSLGANGTAMAAMLANMNTAAPAMTLLGSSFSAPGWMKRNGVLTGNGTNNNLQDTYLNSTETDYSYAWAQYFVKYIQAYQKAGAPVSAVTIQNEPLYSTASYPSMYVYDYESSLLIKNRLAPAFSQAGITTQIWAYDHNTDHPEYPQTVLNDAGSIVNTVAWHCYSGGWNTLSQFKANNTNVIQYMTECWTPSTQPWYNAAAFTMGPLQNWASGAMAWTLASDASNGPHLYNGCTNCTGLITINADGSYTLNTAYYMMAQFSKYMPRNAVVLPVNGSGSDSLGETVQSVATINPDGTRSVVIMNTVQNDVWMTLNTTGGQQWSGVLPGQSTTTWVLPKAS